MKTFAWLSAPIFFLLLFLACLPSIADDQQWADPLADWDDGHGALIQQIQPSLIFYLEMPITEMTSGTATTAASQCDYARWMIDDMIDVLITLGGTEAEIAELMELQSLLGIYANILRSWATVAPTTTTEQQNWNSDDGSGTSPGSEGTSGSGGGGSGYPYP